MNFIIWPDASDIGWCFANSWWCSSVQGPIRLLSAASAVWLLFEFLEYQLLTSVSHILKLALDILFL